MSEQLYKHSDLVNDKTEKLRIVEANLITSIAKEVEAGKPKFTNETSRNAELLRVRGTSPEWVEAHTELNKARDAYQSTKIKAEKLNNDFSSVKHLSDLYSSWMKQK